MCDSGLKCRGGKMAKELILLGVLLIYSPVESNNILEEIKLRPSLSKAAAIIEEDSILPLLMRSNSFTGFIPTNDAMDAYNKEKNADLMKYHLVNLPYKIQNLPGELTTPLNGNPRLYVTRLPSGLPAKMGYEDFHTYINNALITDGNIEARTEDGHQQYLHIVDQVIPPTTPRITANTPPPPAEYIYPDAQKLLMRPSLYGLDGNFSISEFMKRVKDLDLMKTFNISGKNTFFIPINQALTEKNLDSKDMIDKQVIDGHIIPNRVLFTRTVANLKEQFQTMAFTDNLKVFLSMENVTANNNETIYYVNSNTVAGDIRHDNVAVLARIPLGNIPVKNGVVHLIDRPLMIVASSIFSYLVEEKGQLTDFFDLLRNHYNNMTHTLMVDPEITLFAPSNKAFKKVKKQRLEQVTLNQEKLKKLVRMHMMKGRLTTDEIVKNTVNNKMYEVETMSPRRKLFFDVANRSAVIPTVTLAGGGVNATISTANIAAKNGVIHIIDHILGIPSQTVYEKLASDPMMSTTFNLSKQEDWSKLLDDRNQHFTLFVPSNDAWEVIHETMASAYKKLFMGAYAYHGNRILERHMIVGHDLSLEELSALTTNTTKPGILERRLDMTRGKIYFQASVRDLYGDPREYTVEWKGVRATVIRPDVECVNGVVHVIDKVLMAKDDVTVSGSATPAVGLATLAATFVTVAFARALHR